MRITILPFRTIAGFDGTPNAVRLEAEWIAPALERIYKTDAHFVPYVVIDEQGTEIPMRVNKLPRAGMTKSGIQILRENGLDVACTGIVLDVDAPKHVKALGPAIVREWAQEIAGRIPNGEPAGLYFTRGGMRLFWPYNVPIPPERHEIAVAQYVKRVADYGIDADPKCKDWTREFRLPNVMREFVGKDGKPERPPEEQRSIIIPARDPIAPPLVVVTESGKIKPAPRKEPKVSREDRIAAARAYLETAPVAVSGLGGDQTTFLVAQMIVRGANLEDADAFELMREWNAKCQPPWPEERLTYKIAQARDHGHVEWNSLVWTKAFQNTHVESSDLPRWSQAFASKLALEEMARRHGEIVADDGEFWRYESATGVWRVIPRNEIGAVIRAYDGATSGPKSEVKIDHATISGALKIAYMDAEKPGFFTGAAPGIAFTNGRYVVGQGLVEHSKEARLRAFVPFPYDPNAQAPKFAAALAMSLEPDVIALVQEFAGVCLAGKATAFQKVLMFEGFGDNGKSVLIDVISALFPEELRTSIEPQMLDHGNTGSYWRATLAGKVINIVTDLSSKAFEDTSGFKRAAVGDLLNARRPGEPPFTFRPIAGNLFSANDLPRSVDLSDGFFRRWLIVKFERAIPKEKQIKGYAERIITTEMPGVAAWAIAGAERAIARGSFAEPDSVKATAHRWKRSADPYRVFVEDEIAEAVRVGAAIATRDLLRQAELWAARAGVERPSIHKLTQALRAFGFEPARDEGERKWERKRLIH